MLSLLAISADLSIPTPKRQQQTVRQLIDIGSDILDGSAVWRLDIGGTAAKPQALLFTRLGYFLTSRVIFHAFIIKEVRT